MKSKETILCEDGSYTLFNKEFNELYHSTKDGALNESLKKHINIAFKYQNKKEVTILDICFGLGYNTLCTLLYTKDLPIKVNIISPEIDKSLINSLNSFPYPKEFEPFKEIIDTLSKNYFYEDKKYKIEIILGDAREIISTIETKIDIIYQDAFSPSQNPLLWTKEYFKELRDISKDDVILTTYSNSASTRLALYENGFVNIYNHKEKGIRDSLFASLKKIKNREAINMELKKIRNPNAKSLRDKEYKPI